MEAYLHYAILSLLTKTAPFLHTRLFLFVAFGLAWINRPPGGDIQPKRDLTRFVKWPEYVRLQRQAKILRQRLKVPPSINQFTNVLDKNIRIWLTSAGLVIWMTLGAQIFKLCKKYRPETPGAKKIRLRAAAEATAEGKKPDPGKKPIVLKFGINHITALVEAKKPALVMIAYDVDPIEIVLWLPALCRKMGIPYCIVKDKALLGRMVHQKTATAIAIVDVGSEDKSDFSSIVSAVKANYNDKAEEIRRTWGGGIMGPKSRAASRKKLAAANENTK
ncbi:MAG: 60S ribosomal protein L8 [Olpidium bornovanus]|uniref:60S ribosomal protein L8 n=1 Tax=Olpidium bornovanus TaxID=278681 RepID=A0A8H8DJA7_9FUNG|nr:MAG: 60S ribosomal protein L8 [Olpidium bornovanus]